MIRAMTSGDKPAVLEMMRTFYASPAVFSNGSDTIFSADIDACVGGSPYLEGYVFEDGGRLQGYAMLAKSFSTEFGKPCIWIEDLYLLPQYRGQGMAGVFFKHLEKQYPGTIHRLEVEEDNAHAVHVYRKNSFDVLPYMEMKKLL